MAHEKNTRKKGGVGKILLVLVVLLALAVGGALLFAHNEISGNGRPGTVINDLGSSLGGAFFHKVDTQSLATPYYVASFYAKVAQRVHCVLADLMGGNLGNECGLNAVIGQRHRHIGLTAGIGCLKFFCLLKP